MTGFHAANVSAGTGHPAPGGEGQAVGQIRYDSCHNGLADAGEPWVQDDTGCGARYPFVGVFPYGY